MEEHPCSCFELLACHGAAVPGPLDELRAPPVQFRQEGGKHLVSAPRGEAQSVELVGHLLEFPAGLGVVLGHRYEAVLGVDQVLGVLVELASEAEQVGGEQPTGPLTARGGVRDERRRLSVGIRVEHSDLPPQHVRDKEGLVGGGDELRALSVAEHPLDGRVPALAPLGMEVRVGFVEQEERLLASLQPQQTEHGEDLLFSELS